MCVNYIPATKKQLEEHFKVHAPELDFPLETWPDYLAPIIRSIAGSPQAEIASFGLIPKKKMPPKVRFDTVNARAETVGQLKTYRGVWQSHQLCLVPVSSFFEPNYETGKAVRWRIGMADEQPFAIAGLWRSWDDPEQPTSFTMLTVNADEHPLMKRFHKPEDEKRMLVIVPESDYGNWLACKNPEEARAFLQEFPAELMEATPAPRLTKKAAAAQGSLL